MEKEVKIAIIGALAVIGGSVIESGALSGPLECVSDFIGQFLSFGEGGGPEPSSVPSSEQNKSSTQVGAISDEAEISEEPPALESLEPDKNSPKLGAVSEEAEISEDPPKLDSLQPNKTSPQETGTAIRWTAMAEDPDDETLRYRFFLMGPNTAGSWDEVQEWSPLNFWSWNPSEAGSYHVKVEAGYEDEGSSDGNYASLPMVDYQILVAISEEDPAVAVSSWEKGRLDLFVRGKDGALHHRSGDGSTWSGWTRLGEELLNSAPAAVSRGPNTIDVFARGEDNDLMHKRLEGSTWSGWESLGGNWTSAPAASSWGEDRLDVFVRGTDNALWHKWWNGSASSDWESLGETLTSAPAAVSWGPDDIQVFVRGTGGDIKYRQWNGSTWSGWVSLGGILGSAPAASSKGLKKLHVFARSENEKVLLCRYRNPEWNKEKKWVRVPSSSGELTSAPAAVSWGSDRIDVFYKGTDNYLWHEKYDDPSWIKPESIGKWPE